MTTSSDINTYSDDYPIFVSPHRDDICFSLGGFVANAGRGTLINVYTESQFTTDVARFGTSIRQITAIREKEDSKYCQGNNLERIDLGFSEPALRGRRPFSEDSLDDCDLIEDRLIDAIREVRNQHASSIVYCPLGIGRHIDHLAVRRVIARSVPALTLGCNVAFYEDMPYSLQVNETQIHAYVESALPDWSLSRVNQHLDRASFSAKKKFISLYQSQDGVCPVHMPDCEAYWIEER